MTQVSDILLQRRVFGSPMSLSCILDETKKKKRKKIYKEST